MVAPEAEIAAAITDNGRVGVLATPTTVESGAYRRALSAGPGARGDRGRGAGLAPIIQDGLALRRGGDRDRARLLRAAAGPRSTP